MSDCIFCKIIDGEIPSDTVYETEKIKVFKDINPVAPIHLIIVPKIHIEDLNSLDETNASVVTDCILAAKKVAEISGISENGYRVISNCGEDGGQSVQHLHFHVVGGISMGEKIL
ncbi:MAG: histidine triad nucleotide-binding protein [Clostridiales bacterium]|nr:histidine triad nucleotide-binding protein [Clostridiales bacterium]